MDHELSRRARSFGPVAAAYDRGRPGYSDECVEWLVGRQAASVLELGAGTGKLTAVLANLGHDVQAFDVDPQMVAVLEERVPRARAGVAPAEEIPVRDRSVDVVVVAQAFHWFDHERALPEIARVLKPGGHLALAWHARDERIPWVKRLGRLIGGEGETADSAQTLADSELFETPESETFAFWQDINRDILVDLVSSRSYVAVLGEAEREAKLDEVRAFYDGFGRGYDGMQLPYRTRCFRARVIDRLLRGEDGAGDRTGDEQDSPGRVNDGSDTDMLLIDFR